MSQKSVKLVCSQAVDSYHNIIKYVKLFPHLSLSNGYHLDLERYQMDRKLEGSFVPSPILSHAMLCQNSKITPSDNLASVTKNLKKEIDYIRELILNYYIRKRFRTVGFHPSLQVLFGRFAFLPLHDISPQSWHG